MNLRATTIGGWAMAAATLAALGGCGDGPRYEDRRPPVDAIVYDNTGIQAKDVGAATDLFARDLLASSALNASQHQWTIVLTKVQNNTQDSTMNYGVFSNRLKTRLGQMGQGRVSLIENKATYHQLQNEELEGPAADPMGQGGTGGGNSAGVQPDYALYITIDELPNRATQYFNISGTLSNLKTRQIVWTSPAYEFQSAR